MTHRSVPSTDRSGDPSSVGMVARPRTRRDIESVLPAFQRDRAVPSRDAFAVDDGVLYAPAESATSFENSWSSYWETLPCRTHLHRLEAEDFVARLGVAVPLNPAWKVLDFGCGFGLVAAALSRFVRDVSAWDPSPAMRIWTSLNAGRHRNIHVLDPAEQRMCGHAPTYDLIVVNSVLQYMAPAERRGWLPMWYRLLAPEGRVVVSDLIPPAQSMRSDLVDLWRFYAARGCLTRALTGRFGDAVRYWRARRDHPVTRISRDELCSEATAAGLRATFLDVSLTHRSRRDAALLQAG